MLGYCSLVRLATRYGECGQADRWTEYRLGDEGIEVEQGGVDVSRLLVVAFECARLGWQMPEADCCDLVHPEIIWCQGVSPDAVAAAAIVHYLPV